MPLSLYYGLGMEHVILRGNTALGARKWLKRHDVTMVVSKYYRYDIICQGGINANSRQFEHGSGGTYSFKQSRHPHCREPGSNQTIVGATSTFNERGNMKRLVYASCLSIGALFFQIKVANAQNLTTAVMNSTFKVAGPGTAPNTETVGTVFILGRPAIGVPPNIFYYVLVTAAHVLNGISGDQATVFLRRRLQDGSFQAVPFQLQIRDHGKPLYDKNPDADVAVMYVKLPTSLSIQPLPMSLLIDDARIQQLDIQPGDQLQCLGFPLNINLNTFPVIRSGLIASYPLTPTKIVKTIYYNFHVFPGNSGGPVYFVFANRMYGGSEHLGETDYGIIGLVAEEVSSQIPQFQNVPLDISIIVPSTYITDTINMLPDPPAH
jgi:hypothetical protein